MGWAQRAKQAGLDTPRGSILTVQQRRRIRENRRDVRQAMLEELRLRVLAARIQTPEQFEQILAGVAEPMREHVRERLALLVRFDAHQDQAESQGPSASGTERPAGPDDPPREDHAGEGESQSFFATSGNIRSQRQKVGEVA